MCVACELIYLGSVDVPTSGSDVLLAKTVQQLQGLDLSTMNIVTITVSREGVTLQEDFNGSVDMSIYHSVTHNLPYQLVLTLSHN